MQILYSWGDEEESLALFVVGQTVASVALADDKGSVLLRFADGRGLYGVAEGDCCSSSWIEHAVIPKLPAEVLAMPEDVDMDTDQWDENECELTQFYESRIRLSTGILAIEFRNESNGYYGGSIQWHSLEAGEEVEGFDGEFGGCFAGVERNP